MATEFRKVLLDGFGEHDPLYLLIGDPAIHRGDMRRSSYGMPIPIDDAYELIHVISKPAGGEVRGYVLHEDKAFIRRPCTPEEWDEVDRAVEAALGVTVVTQWSKAKVS